MNFMREMKIGDQVFFYHSNCKPPGIVGLMEVIETGLVDPTQFDPKAKYYDPKSSPDKPRWDCVRLHYLGRFRELLSLESLRDKYSAEQLPVLRKGNRLSILPIPKSTANDLLQWLGPLH